MQRINGFDLPTGLAELCDPTRMALLVYDMQAGIVRQLADAKRTTECCATLIEAARAAGMRIVYTRHLSLSKAWMGVTAYRMGMAWQRTDDPAAVRPWFLRDSDAFAIVPELAPTPDDAVFDKLAMSAFEGTPLGFALRDAGILAVAIVGIATEIGIEPTVRHAADLGFIPVVVEDAITGGHQDAADKSIELLKFAGDALFTDVATLSGLMARSAEKR